MAASILVDGKHVFEATGKPMNNKQAMSLSKVRWDRKEGKGTRKDLYEEFEASPEWLVEAAAPKEVVEVSASAACSVSEAEVEREAPKAKKAVAPKKSEEEKKAEKEAAALKKAQDKEAERLRKEAEKLAAKEAATAAKAAAKPSTTPKGKKVAEKVEEKAEVIPPFEFEDDGFAHQWDFKGKKFLRDFEGNMWFRTEEGESAGWAGKFDPATNSIDASAEEPEYEDEE